MMTKSVEDQIEVWIVNDSKYMTQLLSDLVSKNNIKVTNTARDGAEALRKLSLKKPDVILLDLEMPTMDGLTFIEEVVKQDKLVPIIVVSSFSQDGAKIVLDALENGALDFVPISTTNPELISELKESLQSKIEIAAKSDPRQLIIKNIQKLKPKRKVVPAPNAATRIVVIGSSTGGANIVQSILSSLPVDLPAAILVVQHMPKEFGVRPAVNTTMVSGSEVFLSNTIGVLVTRLGHDGAFGMKTIKKRGGK